MKSMLLYTNKEKTKQKKVDLLQQEFEKLKADLDKINEYKKIMFLNL